MTVIKDKFLGCFYGLAIGDAMGFPVEFYRLYRIYELLGRDGVTGFDSFEKPSFKKLMEHPIGCYSDDTQMSLATANALIKSKTNDLEEIMKNITEEYIAWKDAPPRGPGSSCLAGVENLKNGINWKQSGILNAKGCGTAMRTSPIGLCFYRDVITLENIARAASECTHRDEGAIASGIGTAYAVMLALREYKPNHMLEMMIDVSKDLSKELNKKIVQVKSVLDYEDSGKAIKEIGRGWIAIEALALGLYCFMKTPNDYRKTILLGANTNGDSDSIASIAGAISGTYNGINAIPKEWIEQIENKDLIGKTAEALYEKTRK